MGETLEARSKVEFVKQGGKVYISRKALATYLGINRIQIWEKESNGTLIPVALEGYRAVFYDEESLKRLAKRYASFGHKGKAMSVYKLISQMKKEAEKS